ncbi:MAG: STAS domain-containing protein [Robiginitomaculum sp.]|nr:STAS domain-containing protein [Robiginitomaculum sp.]
MAKKSANTKAKTKNKTKTNDIELTQVLDLTAAKPLFESFQVTRGQAITICAKNVERIGGQCVQVLLAASKAWRDDGHAFEITNSSDDFISGLHTFGLNLDVFTKMENA